MEHIEEAGIHSGDSACVLPPQNISDQMLNKIKNQTQIIAKSLKVKGFMNIQFAIKDNELFILKLIQEEVELYHLLQKQQDIHL